MAEALQILVKFVTKLPQDLKVPEAPVAVPVSLKRLGLSQIINHLLTLDPPRPFDFVINDQLLRSDLQQHLLDKQLSAETTLEVEYIPAVVPPKHQHSTPHDDWVSCVDASSSSCIISGSYDGNVRIWNGELECQATFHAHSSGVNAVACLPSSQGEGCILTAGKDHMVQLWQATQGPKGSWACQVIAQYAGHTDAVEGMAVSPSGDRLATCGWEGALLLWRTGAEVVEAAAEASKGSHAAAGMKKRKVEGKGEAPVTASATETPSGRLEGHLHCVSSVCWPAQPSLYSGGWDHSVRRWDVATGINTETYNGSKVVSSVASCSTIPDVVAFGGSDRALRIWDSRSRKGEGLAVQALSSHSSWISCVRWSPSSAHHVATASLDHSVKLWDIRSTVPLSTLKAHTEKVLCVGWLPGGVGVSGGEGGIVSGGADCTLQLYRSENLLQ